MVRIHPDAGDVRWPVDAHVEGEDLGTGQQQEVERWTRPNTVKYQAERTIDGHTEPGHGRWRADGLAFGARVCR
jgi:hypothetical protein